MEGAAGRRGGVGTAVSIGDLGLHLTFLSLSRKRKIILIDKEVTLIEHVFMWCEVLYYASNAHSSWSRMLFLFPC